MIGYGGYYKEQGGVLKNGIAAIGDCRGLVNREWRMVSKEGVSVSCAILARRRCNIFARR